jgi:hypothetical protein
MKKILSFIMAALMSLPMFAAKVLGRTNACYHVYVLEQGFEAL